MPNRAVAAWLNKAHNDILWTESSLKGDIYYGACFSAQQSVEKSLKAYLLSRRKIVRKVHDIGALLEECRHQDPSFRLLRDLVLPLVDYYVQTRYPDVGDLEVLSFVKEKIR